MRIKPDGTVLEGARMPSVEYQMHAAATGCAPRPPARCTRTRRSPPPSASAIRRFPPINTDAVFLRDTVTVPWYMPGSKELADAVGEALKKSRGAILQNHGLMTVGPQPAQGGDARHAARGDGEDRPLHQAVRRHGELLPAEWVEQLAPLADFI